MENSFFSNLKLRGGWGVTGQQEIGPNYGYLGIYTPSVITANIQVWHCSLETQFYSNTYDQKDLMKILNGRKQHNITSL